MAVGRAGLGRISIFLFRTAVREGFIHICIGTYFIPSTCDVFLSYKQTELCMITRRAFDRFDRSQRSNHHHASDQLSQRSTQRDSSYTRDDEEVKQEHHTEERDTSNAQAHTQSKEQTRWQPAGLFNLCLFFTLLSICTTHLDPFHAYTHARLVIIPWRT